MQKSVGQVLTEADSIMDFLTYQCFLNLSDNNNHQDTCYSCRLSVQFVQFVLDCWASIFFFNMRSRWFLLFDTVKQLHLYTILMNEKLGKKPNNIDIYWVGWWLSAGKRFQADQVCCKQADASPTWPVKEGLAGWLWEGSQQTACACHVLQGQPEPQSHLARLTPFPGQPASRDHDWRRYTSSWLRTSGGIICACRVLLLYEWGFVETVSWLIFSPFLKPASPPIFHTRSLFASGQPNMQQGDGALGRGKGLPAG